MDESRVRTFRARDVERRRMWPPLELRLFVNELAPPWRRPRRFIAMECTGGTLREGQEVYEGTSSPKTTGVGPRPGRLGRRGGELPGPLGLGRGPKPVGYRLSERVVGNNDQHPELWPPEAGHR